MNEKEKKLIKFTAIGLSIYLLAFYGKDYLGAFVRKRSDFVKKEKTITNHRTKLSPYSSRVLMLEKLRKKLNIDVRRLSSNELVGQTSQAIQQSAKQSGIKIGPLRETSGRNISSLKFEANGKYDGMVKFLRGIGTSGYPVLIESMQVKQDISKKGNLKINLSIGILDFTKWKKGTSNEYDRENMYRHQDYCHYISGGFVSFSP